MNRKIIISLTIILFLILGNHANATQSPEFVDFVSKNIYDKCQNSDLNIKQGLIFVRGKELPRVIKWPYSITPVKELISIFSQVEPFDFRSDPASVNAIGFGRGLNGYKIMTCGEHYLTVSQYDYILDGNKLNLPPRIINNEVTNQINNSSFATTSGSNSPATSGGQSSFKQNNMYSKIIISLSLVLIFSLAFNVGLTILYNRRKKKV